MRFTPFLLLTTFVNFLFKGKQGFKLSNIDRPAHQATVLAAAKASAVDKSTEHSIKAHTDARSAAYQDVAKRPQRPTPTNLARLKQLFLLGKPDKLGLKLAGMAVFFGANSFCAPCATCMAVAW